MYLLIDISVLYRLIIYCCIVLLIIGIHRLNDGPLKLLIAFIHLLIAFSINCNNQLVIVLLGRLIPQEAPLVNQVMPLIKRLLL